MKYLTAEARAEMSFGSPFVCLPVFEKTHPINQSSTNNLFDILAKKAVLFPLITCSQPGEDFLPARIGTTSRLIRAVKK